MLSYQLPKCPSPPIAFGAVICCTGFPEEKRSVPARPVPGKTQYKGFEFWGVDGLALPNLGLSSPPKPLRVLISGGGDGALQDFLRVLTGKAGRYLYEQMFPHASLFDIPSFYPSGYDLLPFARADDVAYRACQFSEKDEHLTLENWHALYVEEATRIWNRWSIRYRNQLAQNLLRSDVEVTLIHPCSHFGFCYGLNRLLVLLLAQLHAYATGRKLDQILNSSTELQAVYPQNNSHSCGNPDVCHGEPHDVFVQPSYCDKTRTNPTPFTLGVFDTVIVRHGVTAQPFFKPAPFPRQIVPYNDLL